ncbi:ubiquitin-specific protease [Achlya hypogyna]|uniref:Ubiquitin-specific protease n=1 Tax=Achlya hypogyna TaxID=1202772 RepID=A0A1V9Z1Y4_ACHHY|nr:ubiquitin-specific protease [Achlya hypogyna]
MGLLPVLDVWRQFLAANGPMLEEDALKETGLLLATLVAAPEEVAQSLVDALTAIVHAVEQPGATNAPLLLLQLVKHTFHGLKVAKRFESLDIASQALVPVLVRLTSSIAPADGLLHADANLVVETVSLLSSVLVGYQHTSLLYVTHHGAVVDIVETFGQHPQIVATPLGNAVAHLLVTAGMCLAHIHRGRRQLNATLLKAIFTHFESITKPTAADIDAHLRECAWVLPGEQSFLPSAEGLWTVDEFSDPAAAPRSRKAGSVAVKTAGSAHAVPFTATLYDDGKKAIELAGDALSSLPLLQKPLPSTPTDWHLQGQWRQLLADDAPNAMQPAVVSSEWTCGACTVVNTPSATKCATCGTPPPPPMPSSLATATTTGSNPAPFHAHLRDDFMAVAWSRGDTKGMWLASRQRLQTSFVLPPPAATPSHVAFTVCGNAAGCLVIDKPLSVANHATMTLECHFRYEAPSAYQVVVANGEFALAVTAAGVLRWSYGQHELLAPVAPATFHHVALVWDTRELVLVLDGAVAARAPRTTAHEATVGAKAFVIGAEPTAVVAAPATLLQLASTTFELAHALSGSVVELRLWSVARDFETLNASARAVLPSDTPHLVLYLPLVGPSEHLFLDHGPFGNHAALATALAALPVAPTTSLPVPHHRWGVVDGFSLWGAVSCQVGGEWMLESGSALWHDAALGFSKEAMSFETTLNTAFPQTAKASLCFAIANVSYWQLQSLVEQVAAIARPSTPLRSTPPALLVSVTQHAQAGGATVGVYVAKHRAVHCLGAATTLLPTVATVAVQYDVAAGTLAVLLNQRLVLLLAVDLALALGPAAATLRAGIVCPTTSDIEDSAAVSVTGWRFAAHVATGTPASALRAVYGLAGSHEPAATEAVATVSCSKYHTDGSAITQELYGCQSCNSNLVFCKTCAAWCHDGHELVYHGKASGACGCRSRGAAACHCPEPIALPEGRPVLGEPLFGLWCCPQCTVVNPVAKTFCSVCSGASPVAAAAPLQDLAPPFSEAPSSGASEAWACGACTMINDAASTKCTICDTAKPAATTVGTNTRLLALANCAFESMQPAPPAGPWSCGACTMNNDSANTVCSICSTARPVEALPVAAPVVVAPPTSPVSVAASPPLANFDAKAAVQREKARRMPIDAGRFGPSVWETTAGVLVIHYAPEEAYVGDIIHGSYVDGDGSLVGLLKTAPTGHMEVRGKYKVTPGACDNSFLWHVKSLERFDGYWYRGDGSGPWRCTYTSGTAGIRGLHKAAPFYSGLVNMAQNLTNVCYQNSLLQPLFMTQAFRDALLATPSSPNAVVATLQQLFGRLLATHHPSVATHALQRCLPPTFQAGRQQDTSDFANFLMDNLSSASDDVGRAFGGTQATIRRCKTCDHTSVTHEYFWELLLNMIELRYTPITDLCGVTGTGLQIPAPAGFDRLNFDLNKDRHNAPYVYLCVKRDEATPPITDLLIKVADVTEPKPSVPGYTRMEIDLNVGGGSAAITIASPTKKAGAPSVEAPRSVTTKKQVYLFYSRDPHGSPITDLTVVYGTETVPDGFRPIRVDLNQGDGTPVYLCYRSDMPITDLKLVAEGRPGYKLLDQSLHLVPTDQQYIAHTDGGHGACVTGLRLVPAAEVEQHKANHWEDLALRPAPASGARLMLQRGHGNPLYAIEVFRAPRMVPRYSEYEVIPLHEPTPAPLKPVTLVGVWKAGDDCDRSRRAVHFHHVAPSAHASFRVTGSFGTKGVLRGVLQWLPAAQTYALVGQWTDHQTKQPQVAHLLFRPHPAGGGLLEGTIGDGKGKNVLVRGSHVSTTVATAHPITDIVLLRKSELAQLPAGVLVLPTPIHADLCLGVRRELGAPAVKEVCIVYGDIDPIPDDYTCVHTTLTGASANLNDGHQGVPLFVCFKTDTNAATQGLSELVVLSGSDTPDGFTKIAHTPLGMEANLQPGKALFLGYKRGAAAAAFVEHPLNGQFDTSLWGALQLVVAEALPEVCDVVGKYGFTLHGNAQGGGALRGLLYPSGDASLTLVGFWETTFGQHNSLTTANYSALAPLHATTQPFELVFSQLGAIPTATGTWAQGASDGGKWALVKDCYVHVAYKKDYGSEWAHGALQTSDRVATHALPSLLRRFVAPRTLAGDLTCDHCGTRAESRVHSTVVAPPAHLILTLKRMHYDWKLQKTCKSLHDVSFPARLPLPSLAPADAAVVDHAAELAPVGRTYGLYAVLVHSGVSANSGHYYSYCRDTAGARLDLEDDPAAPWLKFNDTTLGVSSWREMNDAMVSSVSDSVYLLFYKRLDVGDAGVEESKSEDDEAMLLAKAMALSMSSTQAALDTLEHVPAFAPETQQLLTELEADNSRLWRATMEARAGDVGMDELHAAVRAHDSVPEPYKSALASALRRASS